MMMKKLTQLVFIIVCMAEGFLFGAQAEFKSFESTKVYDNQQLQFFQQAIKDVLKQQNEQKKLGVVEDRILIQYRKIIQSIDFSDCSFLTGEELLVFAEEELPLLKGIDLSGRIHVTDESMRFLLENCPNLEKLVIAHCTRLTNVSLAYISTYSKKLRYLDVTGCKGFTDNNKIIELTKLCPKLKTIRGIGSYPKEIL